VGKKEKGGGEYGAWLSFSSPRFFGTFVSFSPSLGKTRGNRKGKRGRKEGKGIKGAHSSSPARRRGGFSRILTVQKGGGKKGISGGKKKGRKEGKKKRKEVRPYDRSCLSSWFETLRCRGSDTMGREKKKKEP